MNLLSSRCMCWVDTWAQYAAFKQPAVHEVCALALFDGLIKLASGSEDYDYNWVFSRIFFSKPHPWGWTGCWDPQTWNHRYEWAHGNVTHSKYIFEKYQILWFSILIPTIFAAKLVFCKAPHLSNLKIPCICVLTQMHYRRTRLNVHMYVTVAVTSFSTA